MKIFAAPLSLPKKAHCAGDCDEAQYPKHNFARGSLKVKSKAVELDRACALPKQRHYDERCYERKWQPDYCREIFYDQVRQNRVKAIEPSSGYQPSCRGDGNQRDT
jgi:hypothetical protein